MARPGTRREAGPIGAARDAAGRAGERFDAARDAVAEVAQRIPKPRLRGVSHQWAFFVSLIAGAALIVAASGGREATAVSIYAFSLSALLGTSAPLSPRQLAARRAPRRDASRARRRAALREADVGSGFRLVLDTGTFHGGAGGDAQPMLR